MTPLIHIIRENFYYITVVRVDGQRIKLFISEGFAKLHLYFVISNYFLLLIEEAALKTKYFDVSTITNENE